MFGGFVTKLNLKQRGKCLAWAPPEGDLSQQNLGRAIFFRPDNRGTCPDRLAPQFFSIKWFGAAADHPFLHFRSEFPKARQGPASRSGLCPK